MYKIIGEVLLFAFSLPMIGYQTLMGLEALIDVAAQVSEYARIK